MNLRSILWATLITSLAVMLGMMYLQNRQSQAPSASQPAPETRPTASTTRAATRAAAPAATRSATRPATPATPATNAATAPAASATATQAVSSAPATSAQDWRNDIFSPHQRTLGSLDAKSGYLMQVELTNLGAAIKSAKLTAFFVTVQDKRRYQKDPATYEQAVATDPKLKGHFQILSALTSGGEQFFPLATTSIRFPQQGVTIRGLSGPRWQAEAVQQTADGQQVSFVSEIMHQDRPFVVLRKTYSLSRGGYDLKVGLEVENRSDQDGLEFTITQLGPLGIPRDDIYQADRRAIVYGRLVKGEVKVVRDEITKEEKRPLGPANAWSLGRSDGSAPILWLGETSKYFAALAHLMPVGQENVTALTPASESRTDFLAEIVDTGERTFLTELRSGPLELAKGKPAVVQVDLYVGPKKLDTFQKAPYEALRYQDVIEISSWCTWAPLSRGMLWLLNALSRVTFGNYGVAILILVVLTRLALHPLTKKSQVAMSKMQKFQPEMQKIREKYKDDKAKLNEEMMKLYKQSGSTPVLGCLPMFLQMPIWVALWTALSASVELRHAGFLPFWITDLSAPDELFLFGRVILIPLIGTSIWAFNLLPILLAVAMGLQQKFTPTSTPSSDPQQARTQKIMMYFMTGFMLLIFYNQPSGLNLYIMASTFAGVAEQYVIRKHIRERDAAEAAGETRVSVGKAFRDQRPKKPKGPFRLK